MMKKTCVFFCLLVLFGTPTVFALPVTFDLTVSNTAFTYSAIPTNLTVGASFEGGNSAEVTWTTSGLGVLASADGDTTKTLDGDALDALEFYFDRSVQLLMATFSWVNSQDHFSLLVDGLEAFEKRPVLESFDFSQLGLFGDHFTFSAADGDDSFRISSITVNAPAPVPEPSTWLLLSVGIGGLAFGRRRC